ncbi:hypothetical protein HanXRQr2_Chr08g0318771 [Helianthus annuus]|uniref:Uncharacterized protein n=1 Tax=Helianthus annuus TaxID=4232 RepID=A0A9K3NB17_HELAN|nr:hypothetical protein HanXRQr2_Chr08g0318771 [Helianthus annuus]
MKMAIFQTFWIKMRKNKPLDDSRKSGQTKGWHFTKKNRQTFVRQNHQTRPFCNM